MVLVNTDSYDFSTDNRLLIPFVNRRNKIGFYNKDHEVVCKPAFDAFYGNCKKECDYIIVGNLRPAGWSRAEGSVAIYEYLELGVIDSSGNLIIEVKYDEIYFNSNIPLFVVKLNGKYGLINTKGDEIITFGDLDKEECLFKAFEFGCYRSVDHYGSYGRLRNSETKHHFSKTITDSSLIQESHKKKYKDFAGSYAQDVMGYSDDVINDAFEGDPDAYWNID